MCMEDYLIGKATTKARQSTAVSNVAVPILQADDHRRAITISSDGVAAVWISDAADMIVGQGFILKATDNPITFDADLYGDFVRGGLYAIGAAIGPTMVGIVMSMFSLERFLDLKKANGV